MVKAPLSRFNEIFLKRAHHKWMKKYGGLKTHSVSKIM
jgi:hypothetical protein